MSEQGHKHICVVTWRCSPNQGTNLQAYALCKKLEDMGCVVKILSWVPKFTLKYYIKLFLSFIGIEQIRLYAIKAKLGVRQSEKMRKIQVWGSRVFDGVTVKTKWQLRRLVKWSDCFITGSDQIWNTYFRFNPFMFLSFVCGRKKIAYASSIGTSHFNPKYRNCVRDWLSDFSYIGVREKTAVKVISELTDRNDVVQVVDPTFLLTTDQWAVFSTKPESIRINEKSYLLCYLLGDSENYKQQVMHVAELTGIDRILLVPSCENPDFSIPGVEICQDIEPREFVSLILNADFICTDSFHATAMSLILHKSFVEFLRFSDEDTQSQNSRIYDLLSRYNLLSRFYDRSHDAWLREIDFRSVNELINQDRERSMAFLEEAINC